MLEEPGEHQAGGGRPGCRSQTEHNPGRPARAAHVEDYERGNGHAELHEAKNYASHGIAHGRVRHLPGYEDGQVDVAVYVREAGAHDDAVHTKEDATEYAPEDENERLYGVWILVSW